MGVTVLGIQHRTGEFNGVHFDNYNLHCTEEVSGDTWQRGSRITYVEKVPADVYYQANAVDQILPGTNITLSIIVMVGLLMYS